MVRDKEMGTCPEPHKNPVMTQSTVASRSASSKMRRGDLPPVDESVKVVRGLRVGQT
jgi:hypothetical protein